ncbi:hypothetical protein R3W88_026872 [Solanum pinnatisectum]|uniref:Retrotransposon gag domain-containing protein n=1 Tax=Solanum pinnatisectum TaxID=50273 RepID=A0AAV9LFQ1_9SOLN|nr:hypothetical protein R3W88_026872 [Solanum pinnatisectum]
MASQETVSTEEVKVLRQQMAEMYEAWMSGQAPPSSIRDYLCTNMSPPIQVSTNDPIFPPGFGPFANTSNVARTSTVHPLNTPMMSNPLFVPTAPTNSIPRPIMSSHVEAEKVIKNEEHEEMARRMKSLEQSVKDMQGLGGHKSVSFNDLCMFPHVYLPIGFKTPTFEKYDGHRDLIAHLKRYFNQLRGVGSKEELLMAYFGENLMGIVLKWFIDQDTSNWHTWDDLA